MKTFPGLISSVAVVAVIGVACGHSSKSAASDTKRYCELARTMAAPPTGIDPATATRDQLNGLRKVFVPLLFHNSASALS